VSQVQGVPGTSVRFAVQRMSKLGADGTLHEVHGGPGRSGSVQALGAGGRGITMDAGARRSPAGKRPNRWAVEVADGAARRFAGVGGARLDPVRRS